MKKTWQSWLENEEGMRRRKTKSGPAGGDGGASCGLLRLDRQPLGGCRLAGFPAPLQLPEFSLQLQPLFLLCPPPPPPPPPSPRRTAWDVAVASQCLLLCASKLARRSCWVPHSKTQPAEQYRRTCFSRFRSASAAASTAFAARCFSAMISATDRLPPPPLAGEAAGVGFCLPGGGDDLRGAAPLAVAAAD